MRGIIEDKNKITICVDRSRQNRKERMLAAGYVPRPKGRPRKEAAGEEVGQHNERAKLRMQLE